MMLTTLMVLCLLFNYVAAINKEHDKVRTRAPWCARGRGCASLLLEPLGTAVDVPLSKYTWVAGSLAEVMVTLIISFLVASLVLLFMIVIH